MSQRFWRQVNKTDTCWLWTGPIFTHTGYGLITIAWRGFGSKTYGAHRVSWMLEYGPLPDEALVCHTCDVRLCVRPSHLFLGTRTDNMHDASVKGRMATGANHGKVIQAKARTGLDEDKVRRIRELRRLRVSPSQIAATFGVSPSTVWAIFYGKSWAWVSDDPP